MQETKRGRGRPPKSIEDHKRDGTFRPHRHAERWRAEHGDDPMPTNRYPLSPRRRLLDGGDVEQLSDGPWIADVLSKNGYDVEAWQREQLDWLFAFDQRGDFVAGP